MEIKDSTEPFGRCAERAVPVDDCKETAAVRTEERLLTSDFACTTAANFFNAFGMQMLVATLPVYVIAMGGSRIEAGLVSGALAFTALLFRPFVGWLTDAWRRRPLVLVGTSCYGFAAIVYLLAASIPVLLLGRIVNGFGLCCYTTAANAYVADIAPVKRRAEAVGIFSAAQALGLIVGPVIGFVLIAKTGFAHLFYFSAALAFAAFAVSIPAREKQRPGGTERRAWTFRTGIVAVDALPAAWMALCMGTGFGTVNAFISIFAQGQGIANPGFFFMIQAGALLVSRAFTGRLADRYGRGVAIVPGIAVMAAALAVLPWAHDVPLFVVSAFLFGIGFGAAQPASMALLIDRVRPERRGIATSTYFTGFDAGVTVGSILLGLICQYWDFSAMWLVSAACTLAGLAGCVGRGLRGIDPFPR